MDPKLFLTLLSADACPGSMMCAGRLINIVHHLLQAEPIKGDVVELGCYMGRTTALMTCVSSKPIWAYDSFEGLPERTTKDMGTPGKYQAGSLAVRSQSVYALFKQYGLRMPTVCQSWFKDLRLDQMPPAIAFALLDGDFYASILDSLRLVYPLLSPGARCVIDDYGWPELPGAQRAADEFLADKPEKVTLLHTGGNSSQGFFIKEGA